LRPPWVPVLAALLVIAMAIADALTGESTIFVPLYVLGPLLASMAAGPEVTAVVAALACVLGATVLAVQNEMSAGQDVIRLLTVVFGSALAVWISALRMRLHSTVAQLDVIFERAPIGIAVLGTDVRYVRVNDRLAEINGVPAPDHVGRTIPELLPDLPPQVAADVVRVARSGEPLIEVEVTGATPAGAADRQFLASYWPVRRSEELIGVGIVVQDVTDRRAAEHALRDQTDRYEALLVALSDAGEGLVVLERDGRCVFANSAFEQLSGYTFPELAAMESALDLVVEYESEEVRSRAVARLDQGLVTPSLPLTVRRRDGELVDVEVGGVRLDVEDRRQMVVVVRDVTARRRAEAERERLLAERDHVARTLQGSLLPRELPDIPGVELAARYLPAGAGNEVGGDFYDCFETGSGDWALVIGDVCGKGAEAAALTALARYTVRAAALQTRSPSAILRRLNEVLLRDEPDYRFCTVLYVSLTPHDDGVSICLSSGGHPLPLVLRADGAVATAGAPGSLLGIVDPPELAEQRLELLPGDTLVLFTDGVTEADRTAGPERLATQLAACRALGAAQIAEAVERDAVTVQGGAPRDDVAVVVARAVGAPAPFARLEPGVATAM
jgi:sigma-B regulation protein RsbU (phosphoserine phosphatase)